MIVGTDSSVNPPGFVGPNFACPAYISVLGFYFVQIPATFVGFVAAMGGLSIKSRDWFCIVGLAGQVLAMIGSGYVYASLR